MSSLHINHVVAVKLTAIGATTFNDHYMDVSVKHRPVEKRKGDTFTAPLWEVMNIFGPKMHHGSEPMFDPSSIEI